MSKAPCQPCQRMREKLRMALRFRLQTKHKVQPKNYVAGKETPELSVPKEPK
jgi:hypothetical protein